VAAWDVQTGKELWRQKLFASLPWLLFLLIANRCRTLGNGTIAGGIETRATKFARFAAPCWPQHTTASGWPFWSAPKSCFGTWSRAKRSAGSPPGTRFLPHCPSPGQARLVWLPTTVSWSPLAPNAIRVLDARTGKALHPLGGHDSAVVFVDFSADGKRIISAGDATVRIWDARTGKRSNGSEATNIRSGRIAGCRPQFLGHQRL